MDFMTALTAVSHGLDALKKIRDIEKDFDAATYKLRVAELADALATAKIGLIDAKEEMGQQDAEIKRLKKSIEFHGQLVEHRDHLYEPSADGQPTGSPYCPVCVTNNMVHIRLARDPKGMRGTAFCPRCNSKFSHVDFRPPKQITPPA